MINNCEANDDIGMKKVRTDRLFYVKENLSLKKYSNEN